MSYPSCVVLLSGGQDSTTCLFWALQHFVKVYAIGFDYGQRHLLELSYAKDTCQDLGIPFYIFNTRGLFSQSSLLEEGENIHHYRAHPLNKDVPNSFVPARNALFLTIAGGYAHNLGVQHLVCGVCETDYSGYPDCRQQFIKAQEHAIALALDTPMQIHTPLMLLTKAEVWRLARELSSPECDVVEWIRLRTLSDYNGNNTMNDWGRGQLDNPASELRARGYREARDKGWI